MTTPVRVAVIPAAGLGTRFLPVTKTIPKEMLPLLDRPVIDFVIAEAVAAGIEEVIVVSAPGKRALDAYFEPHPALERRLEAEGRAADLALARRGQTLARITVVHQQQPLGNGHAVLCARDAVGDRPFVMIWGDDITVADPPVAAQLIAARERLGGGSVAAVMRVSREQARAYGVIDGEPLDERIWRVRGIIEKPASDQITSDLASVHGYVLEPEIFPLLTQLPPGRGGEIWLTDAVNILAQRQPVYAYRFKGERFDTGDRAGYVRAVVSAALARPELAGGLREWLAEQLSEPNPGK